MGKRVYNIVFHTHTISGIIISAALYVIFFTGSISFLRDEISAWERNEPISADYFRTVDFDKALHVLSEDRDLYGRDISFSNRYFERRMASSMTASKDTTMKAPPEQGRRENFFYMDMDTFEKRDYTANYSLGEFFYRLHFFAQLNFFGRSGYFLSGLVAFFFLFSVITGVVVHWKKIIQSFYVFRPGAKWKTIWTDAHVALGMIGLPYQFMFALTGCYLMIGYMFMLPPVEALVYDGDAEKLQKAMRYEAVDDYPFEADKLERTVPIGQFIDSTLKKYPDVALNQLQIFNYGDTGMHVKVSGSPRYSDKLLGTGHLTFRASDGMLADEKNPYQKTGYVEGASDTMRRLHYGDFGGYGMKLIYLVLGFVTCFVILSGVLIWLVARKNKTVSRSKQRFNEWLVHVYLAVCLSLYPITAIAFIAVKLFADTVETSPKTFLYQVFFWGWLVFSVFFIFKRNNRFTNMTNLFLGGILGFFVPISNGIVTGNWPWISWSKGYSQIFVVDVFWIVLSLTAFAILLKLKANAKNKEGTTLQKKKPLRPKKQVEAGVPL
ncbi:PepSY-associated TM helix domain-containing protein [Pricia sp. S334]|uniref:PepSY-associated TM helix domain-containing protein n=1 Tax=Pricia mediterranea TaxID=3076079 RepID=A0ABU3LA62_9FLAO|nr:PepSY-associated TM helix domain-containing protein [Pricia sp. S334]MDT7830448.1 PepSY-associated TM helix domain-containing protein [Pricia sp. S334]